MFWASPVSILAAVVMFMFLLLDSLSSSDIPIIALLVIVTLVVFANGLVRFISRRL